MPAIKNIGHHARFISLSSLIKAAAHQPIFCRPTKNLHLSACAVNSDKSATKSGACRAISDCARSQNVLSGLVG